MKKAVRLIRSTGKTVWRVENRGILEVIILCMQGYRGAVKYLDPRLVVKAAARFWPVKNDIHTEVLLTIGKPNFRERQFIRACRAAGERFPVRKVQVREWPAKKGKVRK